MTRDASRPVEGHTTGTGHARMVEIDLLSTLWEEAPFARLPIDAPPELTDLVENIENPKRVYAIHKAARRHNFQLLLQKYIVQLRDGCGAGYCETPTCFTCRRRIVGRAPIRRYNTTSARALAVYLASQDNAENGLCPSLRLPKTPPAALGSLSFAPAPKANPRDDRLPHAITIKGKPYPGSTPSLAQTRTPARIICAKPSHTSAGSGPDNAKSCVARSSNPSVRREPPQSIAFSISEESVKKDHRSFTANLFETVAFKMLEWLTPTAMEDMSRKSKAFGTGPAGSGDRPETAEEQSGSPGTRPISPSRPGRSGASPSLPDDPSSTGSDTAADIRQPSRGGGWERGAKDAVDDEGEPREGHRNGPPAGTRRNSNATVRSPKPKRPLSIDSLTPERRAEDTYAALPRSPRANVSSIDRVNGRAAKTTGSMLPRPISQLSSAGFFDDQGLEKMPPPIGNTGGHRPERTLDTHVEEPQSSRSSSSRRPGSQADDPGRCQPTDQGLQSASAEMGADDEDVCPQALSRLSAEVVSFMCDVLQQDDTVERHLLEPSTVSWSPLNAKSPPGRRKPLKRRALSSRSGKAYPPNMKLEWKLFAEQSMFYVLSDPDRAIESFTKKGQLYDSHTLWYCMLRLTRAAPSLVFHSLWLAAARLFAPPKSLQTLHTSLARFFPSSERACSNVEAGRLMSICLHALVAAAPLVSDPRQRFDMSRIRSQGLSLPGRSAPAHQPSWLCLQYDDAFSNELAMRLARRLFAAITVRYRFDVMGELADEENDVLAPLFSQLDLDTDAVYVLSFSVPERALHETRVPTLLLDWARAVIFHDWDGHPEVPRDGPCGGALVLTHEIYKRRQALLLGDNHLRTEYFAERLDPVAVPVAWLSHTSSMQKLHLLDFPFLFNPATLVSYFRAINLSRMGRSHEEANMLEERIQSTITRSNFTMNRCYRDLLNDLLKTSSAKFLVLDINRDNAVMDAFDQLWQREERELLRPLKVRFGGEDGIDLGGLQQEFFQLVMAHVLNPDYGLFTVDERTRMAWFQPCSPAPEWKFELTGLLMSLAVYNGLTLPVTFPKALYCKLLGEPVTELHHIADGWPMLANGLNTLAEWDEKQGTVEDVFSRTYEFSVSLFDQHITRGMSTRQERGSGSGSSSGGGSKSSSPAPSSSPSFGTGPSSWQDEEWPSFSTFTSGWFPSSSARSSGTAVKGGSSPSSSTPPLAAPSIPAGNGPSPSPNEPPMVTAANRDAYVSDYIRYLTDVSVRPQYDAFARGFRTCLHPKSLALLSPSLLQSVVEGVQEIDALELRRAARYVGWDATHRCVRDFWAVVQRYDQAQMRRLLEFVTASDRVPVGGVAGISFTVQRNGGPEGADGHLPTAATCFGTLLMPEYHDREALRQRLATALENAQGFGMA